MLIGSRVGTSFPGNDYGLVQYVAGAAAPTGDVSLYNGSRQDITTARNAIVGEPVVAQRVDHRPAQRLRAAESTRP